MRVPPLQGGTTLGGPLYTDGIDTICLGRFIVHIHTKRPHVKNSKLSCASVHEIYFILANSADPGEMSLSVAFHLGIQFAIVPVLGFPVYKRVDDAPFSHTIAI